MNKQGYGARERIVVPLLFPLLTGALLVAAAFVDAATPTAGPGVDLAPGAGWTFAALGLAFGICGGVVLRFDPRQRFGWLLGGFGLFWGLDGLAQSYVRFGIRSDEALAGVSTALWFLNRFGAFLPMTVAVLLLIFPTGTFLPGRWGVAGRSALAPWPLPPCSSWSRRPTAGCSTSTCRPASTSTPEHCRCPAPSPTWPSRSRTP